MLGDMMNVDKTLRYIAWFSLAIGLSIVVIRLLYDFHFIGWYDGYRNIRRALNLGNKKLGNIVFHD